ncbi:MAG TPA: AAA family ATPase [Streptosporangiaceae bacterium]|jgi:DNA-binding CsgD family transcriptional regulator
MSLVGRDAEGAAVLAGLGTGEAGARAVLLVGEAGIGKTAVWDWATQQYRTAGGQVLLSRATAAEARLPWVGLTDLLRSVPDPITDSLPRLQGRALRAVALQSGGGGAGDERIVGTAFHTTLQRMAETSPVLLAIDDVPDFDPASWRALLFALRRLDHSDVRFLGTVRGSEAGRLLGQSLPPDDWREIRLGPLSIAYLFELLRARIGVRLPRPLLVRIHTTAGGNPLYALELARALERLDRQPQAGVPLPLPSGLVALVEARIHSLRDDVRELAAATAATWRFTGVDVNRDALDVAVRSGLVVVDTGDDGVGVIRAAHPLLCAAAYNGLDVHSRRVLHQRLAASTEDPVERARHLALASPGPQEQVAAALDAGTAAALAAGVPDIGVELARLALDHTVAVADRPPRLDRLADAQFRAGDSTGALATQAAAIRLTSDLPQRARRRIRLAEIATETTGWPSAVAEVQTAIAEAAGDPTVLAEAMLTLAAVTDDISLSYASAARAVELLEGLDQPDPQILSGALAQAAGARFRAGRGLDHDMFARAIAIERGHDYRRLSDRADANYAALLKYADELDTSETMLNALLDEARAAGDFSSIAYSVAHLVSIALWRGQITQGRAYADEHLTLATQGDMAGQRAQAQYNLGLAMAYQGRLDEADGVFIALRDDPSTTGWILHRAHGGLGFTALSRGDAEAAVSHLDQWYAALSEMHFEEPGYSRSHLDYLCALVAAGRAADAASVLAVLTVQARRSGGRWAAVVARTGHALIDAQAGRLAQAQESIEAALTWYRASPLRFDRARTLLIAGQISRRAKAKTVAHGLLDEARCEFRSFGAEAWEALAAAELARVNVRPRAPAELTETEQRVAELVAAGLTNREAAARAFLAVKTVEAVLGRVYRKLGIRSRAELAARMRGAG